MVTEHPWSGTVKGETRWETFLCGFLKLSDDLSTSYQHNILVPSPITKLRESRITTKFHSLLSLVLLCECEFLRGLP